MVCDSRNERIVIQWSPPLHGVLKFNVDGAAKGKLKLSDISGVLCNHNGKVFLVFSNCLGTKDPNEAGVMAILEAFQIFSTCFQGKLIVESD